MKATLVLLFILIGTVSHAEEFTCSYLQGPKTSSTLRFKDDTAILDGESLPCAQIATESEFVTKVLEGRTVFTFYVCKSAGKKVSILHEGAFNNQTSYFASVGDTYFKCVESL